MQMSFELTESVVNQLKSIPDPDSFVNNVIEKALQGEQRTTQKLSKWALLAQEIENTPELQLDGYSEQLKKGLPNCPVLS